jgi:adhesin transport system outer membrane protein
MFRITPLAFWLLSSAGLASGLAAQDVVYGPSLAPEERADTLTAPPGIPPRLATAAQEVLETYPSLKAASTQVRATQYDIAAAKWLRFPSVSAELVTRRNRITPEVEVVQPVWTGGRIKAGIDRARALRNVADAALSETVFDVLLRVSASYYEVVRGERLQQIYTDSLTEHRRLVGSMERRVEQQVSPRTDLELARARAAQVEQQLSIVVAQRAAALERLRQLVGQADFEIGPLPQYSPAEHHPAPDNALDLALQCDPTIARLHAEVGAAEAESRTARASIYPQLGIKYSYDRFAGSGLGVVAQAQTGGGLSPLAAAQAATTRKQTVEFQVTVAEREAREKVNLDLVENQAAKTRFASTSMAADSTLNVTNSFLRQFVAGRRTWLDLMNAVREAVEARVALVEVENSAMASAARLRLRTCQWLPAPSAGDAQS